MKKIKCFGEKVVMTEEGTDRESYEAFIEYEDGSRKICRESEIEELWNHWICHIGVYRDDKDGFVVFAYKESVEI